MLVLKQQNLCTNLFCTNIYKIRYLAWCALKQAAGVAILSINDAFKNDKSYKKLNLSIGAYCDDAGQPWLLPTVRKAEQLIMSKNLNKEYSTTLGMPEFYNKSIELALGADSCALQQKRYAAMQALSGMDAVSSALFAKCWQGNRVVYVPTPTWINHIHIFEYAGLTVKKYRYFDQQKIALDLQGLVEDLRKMPEKSIVLFQACAHNPTGIDPNEEQWHQILTICAARKLYPFFDMAYQGLASGDVHKDAFPVRLAEQLNREFCVAQSYAKNMGLYGERIAAFSVICDSPVEAEHLLSHIKLLIRAMYSSPPIHGARIAAEILNNKELYECWLQDVRFMVKRMQHARKELKRLLIELGSKHNWNHITQQRGMFCLSGLTAPQVERLKQEFHIYMSSNGRISMASVSANNVKYLAEAMHAVTK